MRTVNHPKELLWKREPLPPVEKVPDGFFALAWIGKDGRPGMVETVMPWGDRLNPRRWCSSSRMPIGAYLTDGYRIEWWAWLKAPEDFV